MELGFVRKLWKFPVETQRETLRESGLPDAKIYQANGEEMIGAIIMAFRGQGGTLKIAADFRVFGASQKEITEVVDALEKAWIKIIDLAHPEHKTMAVHIRWAFARIAEWQRWGGDKKRAKRTGKAGGHAKAVHQARKRADQISEDRVRKLIAVIGKTLTWRDAAEITGISTATLRRHYKD